MTQIQSTRKEPRNIRSMEAWVPWLGGLALLVSLGTMGCAENEPASDEPAARDGAVPPRESDEAVVKAEEALTVCEGVHNHGGDLFPAEYDVILGCDCGAGKVRNYYSVWNTGAGGCHAVGWASTDIHDCRVRVSIHRSGGFANGTCHALVDAKSELNPRSCQTRCGTQAPYGCWCDVSCAQFGDCCPDYASFCR